MRSDFEITMDNDLDVKAAYDLIFENVGRLLDLKEQGRLSDLTSKKAIEALKKMDTILQVIFI